MPEIMKQGHHSGDSQKLNIGLLRDRTPEGSQQLIQSQPRFHLFNQSSGHLHGSQCMFKSTVASTGIDSIRQSQLTNVSQALNRGTVDDVQIAPLKADHAMDRIPDSLRKVQNACFLGSVFILIPPSLRGNPLKTGPLSFPSLAPSA